MEPRVVGHFSNEVIPTHPIYNLPPRAVLQAQAFFDNNGKDQVRAGRAGTQDTDLDVDDDEVRSEATGTSVSDIWNGRDD